MDGNRSSREGSFASAVSHMSEDELSDTDRGGVHNGNSATFGEESDSDMMEGRELGEVAGTLSPSAELALHAPHSGDMDMDTLDTIVGESAAESGDAQGLGSPPEAANASNSTDPLSSVHDSGVGENAGEGPASSATATTSEPSSGSAGENASNVSEADTAAPPGERRGSGGVGTGLGFYRGASVLLEYPATAAVNLALGVSNIASSGWKWVSGSGRSTPQPPGSPIVEIKPELRSMMESWRPMTDEELEVAMRQKVVVAVMGRVSAGKSTLLKALLRIPPDNLEVLQVSALAGTTKDEQAFLLQSAGGEFILLDFPGFQEVYGGRKEDATRFQEMMSSFMRYGRVDIGIYVANGVPDASQKADFDQLAKYAKKMFLVRSKADELERLTEAGRQKILDQWRQQFGVSEIYLTKIIGYDPDSEDFPNARVEGVDKLRDDMYQFLETCNKGAVLDILKYGLLNMTTDVTVRFATIGLAVFFAVLKAR